MNVRFTRNGELLEDRKIQYGGSIDTEYYPILQSTEEYYGRWINPTEGPIYNDIVIMAEDCRYVRALNSNLKRSEDSSRPMFIVEGYYTGNPVFMVKEKGNGLYLLEIPHDGSTTHCIRYDPNGKDVSKLVITYQDGNGTEKNAEIEKSGRCAKFTVEGDSVLLRIEAIELLSF